MPEVRMKISLTPEQAVFALEVLREMVDEQAEDESLWFQAETAPEAYVQQELRRLHAAIEAVTGGPRRP